MSGYVSPGARSAAKQTIDAVPQEHPFEMRYRDVQHVDWESCARVLNNDARRGLLEDGW